MTLRCPGCNVKLKATPDQAGKRFRCPRCRTVVAVPTSDNTDTGTSEAVSVTGFGSPAAALNTDTADTERTEEDRVAEAWKPGDVILDLYEPKDTIGERGFGTVCRVHHRGWNMDLHASALGTSHRQAVEDSQRGGAHSALRHGDVRQPVCYLRVRRQELTTVGPCNGSVRADFRRTH